MFRPRQALVLGPEGLDTIGEHLIHPKVHDKAHPQLGKISACFGDHQPRIRGGNDVRILVREQNVLQFALRHYLGQFIDGLAVELVPAGVEQDSFFPVNDDDVGSTVPSARR